MKIVVVRYLPTVLGMIINQAKFNHVPVVLNLFVWNMNPLFAIYKKQFYSNYIISFIQGSLCSTQAFRQNITIIEIHGGKEHSTL